MVADLPPDKQRMLERLPNSDENLHGRKALLVDDDARNIFALSSVLERRGMDVLTATTGREAIAILNGRLRDHLEHFLLMLHHTLRQRGSWRILAG
jgi:CheY-like chemotaxis protein